MSLLTRCPACTTLYRVVPDQLRISEGWVKCGQCGDIFDASQHLIEATIDSELLGGAEVEGPLLVDSQVPQNVEGDVVVPALGIAFEADLNDQDLLAHSLAQTPALNPGTEIHEQVVIEVETPAVAQSDFVAEIEIQNAEPSPYTDASPLPESDFKPEPVALQVRWDDDALTNSAGLNVSDDELPSEVQPTFLKNDKHQEFWRKPMVRGVLLLMSFSLGMSLLGQWVFIERDRLAAQWPDVRPVLQAFCGFAKCQILPLKRIDALSVDSVGFHQLGKETYRLSFTVKNSSVLPLAFPAVELTLTDLQDLPVYRRVFFSKDLGAAGAEIAAGADWSGAVALRVNSEAPAQRVLGYRLLVFYP
jgi:predicted Zn finger-like uncharacterized protein